MKRIRTFILLLALFTAGFSIRAEAGRVVSGLPSQSPAAAARSEAYQRLSPRLQDEGLLRLIVQLNVDFLSEADHLDPDRGEEQRRKIDRAQDAVLDRLASSESKLVRRYDHIPFLALEVDAAGLEALQESPQVFSFREDIPEPPILDQSIPHVGADAAWTAGYEGVGWSVAVLDSGVDSDHPFLSGKILAEACFSGAYSPSSSVCPNGQKQQTGTGAGEACSSGVEGCSHGTHVAGIAAGSGASFSGVGRSADILAVQVFSRFDDESYCGVGHAPCVLSWVADQLSGLEWVYDQHAALDIAAVNMSLGSGYFTSICDGSESYRKAAIDNLRAVDIPTVIAAGNGYYTDGISTPACISTAISVGNTTTSDTVHASSNAADFMSLFAPGSDITSSVPGGGYQSWYGTSMAAPHVAGAWAVLKSRASELTVDQGLSVLQDTGVLVTDTRSGGSVTRPRLQLDAAIDALEPIVGSFADVPPSHWAWGYIQTLYDDGYVAGCSVTPRLYCPESILHRAESAVFVMRGQFGISPPLPDPETPSFADVPKTHWGYNWIEGMWENNFTAGCDVDPLKYCPDIQHSRAEASVFFLRVKFGTGYSPPEPDYIFADVLPGTWYEAWAEAAYNEGLLPECESSPELKFCPNDPIDRSWAAYMMVQAKGLSVP